MSRQAGNHQPNGAGKDVAHTAMSRFPDPANETRSTAQNVAKRERKNNGNGQVKPEYSRDISDTLRAANEQLLKPPSRQCGEGCRFCFWLACTVGEFAPNERDGITRRNGIRARDAGENFPDVDERDQPRRNGCGRTCLVDVAPHRRKRTRLVNG